MNTREYFNWLKAQEEKEVIISVSHEKMKYTVKVNGFKASIDNAIILIIKFNDSGYIQLPLSPDSDILEAVNGYRVSSDNFNYTIQQL